MFLLTGRSYACTLVKAVPKIVEADAFSFRYNIRLAEIADSDLVSASVGGSVPSGRVRPDPGRAASWARDALWPDASENISDSRSTARKAST